MAASTCQIEGVIDINFEDSDDSQLGSGLSSEAKNEEDFNNNIVVSIVENSDLDALIENDASESENAFESEKTKFMRQCDKLLHEIKNTKNKNRKPVLQKAPQNNATKNEDIVVVISDDSNDAVLIVSDDEKKKSTKKEIDEICFLHEEKPTEEQDENYYESGSVDFDEVKKRWRIKTLATPSVNLSVSNYRKRYFREAKPPQASERKFKQCVIESIVKLTSNKNKIAIPEDGSLSSEDIDKRVLESRIEEIEKHFMDTRNEYNSQLLMRNSKLERIYQEHKISIFTTFPHRKVDMMLQTFVDNKLREIKDLYTHSLYNCKLEFKRMCANLRRKCDSNIQALKELHDTGKYEKGKLNEYLCLSVMQPSAFRRNYVDDGLRYMICTENQLAALLVEDTIYSYYYPSPN